MEDVDRFTLDAHNLLCTYAVPDATDLTAHATARLLRVIHR